MKRERQTRILDIVANNEIETQDELVKILNQEGYEVTQATVSRDINELRLTKVHGSNGKKIFAILKDSDAHLGNKYIRVLRDGFVSMDKAQNILVVRTVSGMAMAVAAAIDAMKLKEVVGSIAGDDTIMMAIRTDDDVKIVMNKIRDFL